jgi:acetylornithine deacetylase/succinyl-diaminopimelate desuccinylase-like protein
VTTDAILDRILIPRPNGSAGLEQVAAFLASQLEQSGAEVALHEFTATPFGFALTWSAAILLLLGYAVAVARRRYGIALAVALLLPALLLAEFELLLSPVSGLASRPEANVVGTFAGAPGGPTLVFGAHYDSTTHFGDHLSWGAWGRRQGPATALALLLPLAGLALRRRRRELPRALALPAVALAAVPFAAMFWFQAIGPLVRAPSPGAIDDGGSLAALLRLAERLAARPAGAPTTVQIAFFAAEEERTLGSWAFSRTLAADAPLAVVNLESIGASDELAWIPEDGFALRRWRSPEELVALVNGAARELRGAELPPRELPFGTLTDGRSFLAHGIPAVTLRAFTGESFPRRLHSEHDSRDRLSLPAIERCAELLEALVRRSDADPELVASAILRARARSRSR